MFYPKILIVLAVMFRSVIQFELMFVYDVNKGLISFFYICVSICPSAIC